MVARSICFIMLVFVGLVGQSTAGIVVTLENATFNPGDSGAIDVMVTGAPANADLLDFFIGTFRITAVGSATAGGVSFDDPQLNPFDIDPSYVFFNNTFGLTRTVTPSINPQDTLTVIDGTADFLGVDVNSQDFLLARIEFTAAPGLVGISQYQLSLIASESQFQTEAFDDISFNSTGGLITITGPSKAVPEPSSALLLFLGSVIAAGLTVARVKKHG